MKILSLFSFWQLFKWVAIIMIGYALIRAGVPPAAICLFLLIRLIFRLLFHCINFIASLFQMAVMVILIIFLFIIF